MIPAVLAAQFAKPLVKWGAIIGGILLLLTVFGVWCYAKGKAHVQTAWDASIAKQAQESALQVIAEAKMSNEVLKAHAEAERKIETEIRVIEKEVVRYVNTTTNVCPLDAGFVRLYDDLRGVLDTDEDGVPTADSSAGEPDEPSHPQATTAEILPALTEFVARVKSLAIKYRHLVQWERGRHIVQQTQRETDQ